MVAALTQSYIKKRGRKTRLHKTLIDMHPETFATLSCNLKNKHWTFLK